MIFIAIGANRPGPWGDPVATIDRALAELRKARIEIVAVSGFYATAGIGPGRASVYVNAAIAVRSARPPRALLAVLKQVERRAGRRSGRRWGPRSLDLDILDYKGLLRGHEATGRPGPPTASHGLVLPHPQMHKRPFVLRPMLDIAPRWRHPRLKRSVGQLWRRVKATSAGRVLDAIRQPTGRIQ